MEVKQLLFSPIRYVSIICILGLGIFTVTGSGGSSSDSGGGKDASSYKSASSSSFSPVLAENESGETVELFWKYEINQGTPLNVYQDGVALTFQFDPLILVIDPADMERRAEIDGEFNGDSQGNSITGSYNVDVLESLDSLDGATMVDLTDMNMNMKIKVAGASIKVDVLVSVAYETPCEWFIDRDNLDELPVGYVYNERGEIYGTATGEVWISGAYEDEMPINEQVSSAEKWEILEKLESYTVRGTTYENVVKVKRETYVPDSSLSGYSSQETELTYWVAKGIGMIKGVGQFSVMGEPLEIELVETNLTVLSESTETE
ncbi:MAG: hypothetical protein KJ737_27840 [Proteobacteria bacterium]|nr:hypothetical protein [Pseudomonadota bacterium]